jgi:uncharacterized protein YecT (DUF1311 family)
VLVRQRQEVQEVPRRLVALGVVLTAVTLPGVAAAAEPPTLACLKTAQSTADMGACVSKAYTSEQRQLRTIYARLLHQRPGDRAQLVRAQRRWLTFRAADCAYVESLYRGGSIAPVQKGLCLVRDTADRVAVLRGYVTP